MKVATVCFAVCLTVAATSVFAGTNTKQHQNFTEKLPAGVSTGEMEKSEGVIREGNSFIIYEIYNKPLSQYYDVIRYKIQHLGSIVFNNELETDEEGLQFIENWRAKMFRLEKKRCWRKLWIFGRCESWREIKTQEEKIRVAGIIGKILRDNLRRIVEKEIMHNQDPAP